jgi:hypothetical protein
MDATVEGEGGATKKKKKEDDSGGRGREEEGGDKKGCAGKKSMYSNRYDDEYDMQE